MTTIHRSLGCLAFDALAEVIWETTEPLLPPPDTTHPLGCHRPRVPDEIYFRGLLIRLVTGSSWVDIEAILPYNRLYA